MTIFSEQTQQKHENGSKVLWQSPETEDLSLKTKIALYTVSILKSFAFAVKEAQQTQIF